MKMKNIILATLTVMVAALFAPAADAQEIKGGNVTMVVYKSPETGKDVQINMDPDNHKKWYERAPDGTHVFNAAMRDEWSVYLWDAKRGVAMQIDLFKKKITYGFGGPNGIVTRASGAYAITHAQ